MMSLSLCWRRSTSTVGMQRRFMNHLKEEKPGLLGTKAIKWNFTKFLIDKNGQVVSRHAPTETPASLASNIEKLIGSV